MDLLTFLLYAFSAICAFLVFVTIYYSVNWNRKHFWVDKNVPYEDPTPFILIMKAIFFSKKPYWELDKDWCQKHGRVFGCYQAGKPTLYVTDLNIIRKILVKDFHLLPDRRVFDTHNPVGNCFLTVLTGDDWKRVRSVITPAFSTGKLKKMMGLMEECAQMTVQNLTKHASGEGVVDCKKLFSGFTLDVIANTAFGTKLNSAQDPDNIFVQKAQQFFNIAFPWRLILIMSVPRIARLLKISAFNPGLMEFFVDLTNSVVKRRKETKEEHGDFLQNLIEAQMRGESKIDHSSSWDEETTADQDDLSEECQSFLKQYSKNKTLTTNEFVAACVLFFLAGFDTTATTIAMTVYFLALNPECQKKVIEEVDEVSSKHPELDSEVLSKLKYLDAAISETLRLIPPLPRLERKATVDYLIEEVDLTIPKDLIVGIPIYAMHTDPEFFPDPKKYDPERFLPENRENIKPYTYLPFGAGPRNCLGMRFALMEIKICLYHVFRELTFQSCAQTKIPPELYKGSGLYQPKAVNLKVTRRARDLK